MEKILMFLAVHPLLALVILLILCGLVFILFCALANKIEVDNQTELKQRDIEIRRRYYHNQP